MRKRGRWLQSHPRALQAREMLGDHVVAGGVVDELEEAGGVALVFVARPACVLRAHLHRVPALEEDRTDGVDDGFCLARSAWLLRHGAARPAGQRTTRESRSAH